METEQRNTTPYPNIPAVLESDSREFRDTGVPSTVAVAGHPIHPILVQFPVAFLVGATLSDVVYFFNRDSFWALASYWLILGGLVGGLAAAATGLMDFLRIERVRKRTAGWAHLILNVAALALTLVNLLIRQNHPISAIVPWGLIISLIVATGLGLSGWYGGELVYRHKISVIGNGSRREP
jgi:uncharacterized membrane protein